MQFRISHLLLIFVVVAVILASYRFELALFRQLVSVTFAAAAGTLIAQVLRNDTRLHWLYGGGVALLLVAIWYGFLYLTWPRFIYIEALLDITQSSDMIPPLFLKEMLCMLGIGLAVGAIAAMWAVVKSDEQWKQEFKIPLTFSQLAFLGAILFRFLPTFDRAVGSRNLMPLSMLCGLVFIVHAFNWVPRFLQTQKARQKKLTVNEDITTDMQ